MGPGSWPRRCDLAAVAAGVLLSCASPGGEAGGPPASPSPPAVLYRNDFDGSPLGTYTVDRLRAEWRDPAWEDGVSAGRVTVVGEPEAWRGRALRILYPAGEVRPAASGAQWQLRLDRPYDELHCAYRIRFGEGFGFVKGGKLPGLAGGTANSGGRPPTGRDGWSARMMWRAGGRAVQYVYHPDQPTDYGQDFPWDRGGQRLFRPGTWHRLEHRLRMNAPGLRDGLLQGWFDGDLALDASGLRFRDVDSLAVDLFFFCTFFGGDDPSWAPGRDEHVWIDDVVVSTGPVGLAP